MEADLKRKLIDITHTLTKTRSVCAKILSNGIDDIETQKQNEILHTQLEKIDKLANLIYDATDPFAECKNAIYPVSVNKTAHSISLTIHGIATKAREEDDIKNAMRSLFDTVEKTTFKRSRVMICAEYPRNYPQKNWAKPDAARQLLRQR